MAGKQTHDELNPTPANAGNASAPAFEWRRKRSNWRNKEFWALDVSVDRMRVDVGHGFIGAFIVAIAAIFAVFFN